MKPADIQDECFADTSSPPDEEPALLRDYRPGLSFAWPGAAPGEQLEFWWGGTEPLIDDECGDRSVFRRAGFSVKRIRGKGAASTMDAFCHAHHSYLRTRGMAGLGYGLYTPSGELADVANFAACSNRKTEKGMQFESVTEDKDLSPQQLLHVRVGEREYLAFGRVLEPEQRASCTPPAFATSRGGTASSSVPSGWLSWACRCRAEFELLRRRTPFIKLVRTS